MKSILVANADEALAIDLRNYLNPSEYEVHWAKDGQEALQRFSKLHPQLLVLDLFLGKVHGYALLRHFGSKKRRKRPMAIIVVTGKAFPQDQRMARELGAERFFLKPPPIDQLCQEVQALLAE
ncbi:MAG: response regulator [Planctomycetes bacterium]|nr:response regulator [Planctomycetota bacterium]